MQTMKQVQVEQANLGEDHVSGHCEGGLGGKWWRECVGCGGESIQTTDMNVIKPMVSVTQIEKLSISNELKRKASFKK